jgi:hypothetical protein
MEQYNRYIKLWQQCILKMNQAINDNNFEEADTWENKANEAYEKYKEDSKLPYENENRNFGELNYIFEDALPRLFKSNKKALKECMTMIKEDKNLLYQFKFYNALSKYSSNDDAKDYIKESLELASNNINYKTVSESVKRFGKLLAKHELGANVELDEDTKKYYSSCTKLLTEKKKITNLNERVNHISYLNKYLMEHKKPAEVESIDIKKMTESLDKKIANLNENERALVKDIIDAKKPRAEAIKEELFNKFKNECINKVNEMLQQENCDEKDGLNNIKEQLENQRYCSETIVKDIAKIMEIHSILFEK